MILSFSFQPILSMSRKPRLYFPGALYHVLLRGNGGQAIFFEPVDQERYLLVLIRYIHLNPIRAGIVKELAEFPWSSHAAYLGGKHPDWLHCDLALSLFSSDRSEARRRDATYIHQGRGIASEVNFKKGTTHPEIIGEDHFVNSVFEQLKMKPHTPPPIEKIIQQVAQV